jgi:hypothetical protein
LIQNALTAFSADVSYFKNSKGHTQLLVIEMSNKEMTSILEEEFNDDQKKFWIPNPYKEKDHNLSIIAGNGDVVKVLSDLETIQKHHYLKKFITHSNVHPLMTYSLNSILREEVDEISLIQAAPTKL